MMILLFDADNEKKKNVQKQTSDQFICVDASRMICLTTSHSLYAGKIPSTTIAVICFPAQSNTFVVRNSI